MHVCGSLSIVCIAFLWDWNENWAFPVLWPLLSFQVCWHIECNTVTASSFRIWNSSTGFPSPLLALFIVMLPKAHLTSHSRMSGSRWVITPLWLSGLWRSFLYSSMYSCHQDQDEHKLVTCMLRCGLFTSFLTKLPKLSSKITLLMTCALAPLVWQAWYRISEESNVLIWGTFVYSGILLESQARLSNFHNNINQLEIFSHKQ